MVAFCTADYQKLLETAVQPVQAWKTGVSLKNRIPSKKLISYLGVSRVTDGLRRGGLRWFGHLEQKCVCLQSFRGAR